MQVGDTGLWNEEEEGTIRASVLGKVNRAALPPLAVFHGTILFFILQVPGCRMLPAQPSPQALCCVSVHHPDARMLCSVPAQSQNNSLG